MKIDSHDTITGTFLKTVKKSGNKRAIMERRDKNWISFTWNEWCRRSMAVAAQLLEMGVNSGDSIAIYCGTRRQWIEADMGVLMCGARTVTIYHNVGSSTAQHILFDCRASIVFAEGPVQIEVIINVCKNNPDLPIKKIIYFEKEQTQKKNPDCESRICIQDIDLSESKIEIIEYEKFIESGLNTIKNDRRTLDERMQSIQPDDVAKIVYTSGTIGRPKGAMLTHRNFMFTVMSVQEGLKLKPSYVMLLFLPLAHVYAQLSYHAAVKTGFTIAFARSMLTVVDDAESVRPHFFTTVPRLFEKIYAAAMLKVDESGGLKKKIFMWAVSVGSKVSGCRQQKQRPGLWLSLNHKVADILVYKKLKRRLGGRVEFMISGGAPISRKIIEFFSAADLPILEGYGMTENASLSHYNRIGDVKFGTVGLPIPGIDVKIADDGEILVAGDNTMKGYLNLPVETKEAIDENGFLHTGDIGELDARGFLTITDRKKEIIITSGGKKTAPAPIENMLVNGIIAQACVLGNRKKFISALVTLDCDKLDILKNDLGINDLSNEEIAVDKRIGKIVEKEISRVNDGLDPFSTIKKFTIIPGEFTIDKGEVTPSLKLVRKVIVKNYKEIVDKMYD